jgi:hypothetical protein
MTGDIITIPGAPTNPYIVRTDIRYDYKANKSKCPVCNGLGFPWRGWFTCDDCLTVAVIADGRVFQPVRKEK